MKIALIALLLIPLHAMARPPKSYCDDYLSFLNNAVYYMRMGTPILPNTFRDQDSEWPTALKFINSQRPGYNFQPWIDKTYLRCWEESPYGPGTGAARDELLLHRSP